MLSVFSDLLRLGAMLALVVFLLCGAFSIRRNQKLRFWKRQVLDRLRL